METNLPGFNADEVRNGIRLAMRVGLPPVEADRPLFIWDTPPEVEADEDTSGIPFAWDAAPATPTAAPKPPRREECAIEYIDEARAHPARRGVRAGARLLPRHHRRERVRLRAHGSALGAQHDRHLAGSRPHRRRGVTVADYDLTPADSVGIVDVPTALLAPGAGISDPVGITDSVGAVAHQPGSVWSPYAASASGGTRSLDFSIVPDSPEFPWPFAWEGDGYSNSLWLVFTAADTQILTLTLTTSFPAGIEVWSGEVIDDPEN